jgi:hypothetical protein
MVEYKIMVDVQINLIIRRMGALPWASVDPIMQIIREVINNGKSEQQARIDQDKLKDIARAVGDTV